MDSLPADGLPSRREWIVAAAALAVGMVLFHGAMVWGGELALGGDIVGHMLPWLAESARGNRLWHPGTFAGFPAYAEPQVALLYPPMALLHRMPWPAVATALTLLQMVHLWLAGMGAFALARRFVALPGALFAAATWCFGATMLMRLQSGIIVFLTALAWLPWMFWALEGVLRGHGARRWAGALAAFGSMQILAGAPQVVQIAWVSLGVYAAARLAMEGGGRWPILRSFSWIALAGAITLAVASPQLVAAMRLIEHASPRYEGDHWAYYTNDSLDLRNLLTWIAPRFYGWPTLFVSWRGLIGYHEINYHVGVVAVCLAFAALGTVRWRENQDRALLAWAFLGAFGLALAFGSNGFLFRIFYTVVPTFDSFRVPARWSIPTALALTILAGIGFQRIFAPPAGQGRRAVVGPAIVLIAILLLLGFSSKVIESLGFVDAMLQAAETGLTDAEFNSITQQFLSFAAKALQLATVLAFASLVAAVASDRFPARRAISASALALVHLASLWHFWYQFRAPMPEDLSSDFAHYAFRLDDPARLQQSVYPITPVIESAPTDARILYTDDVMHYTIDRFHRELQLERPKAYGVQSLRGYSQLRLAAFEEEVMTNTAPGTRGPFLRVGRIQKRVLLDAYNVRQLFTYEMSQSREEFTKLGLVGPFPAGEPGLLRYDNPHARGRAWLSDSEDWLRAGPLPTEEAAVRALHSATGATVERYEIVAARPAVLHVSCAAWPDWAWTKLPAGATPLSDRSIRIPAGSHRIERTFTPYYGAGGWTWYAMAAAIAGMLALLLVPARGVTSARSVPTPF